MSIRSIQVYTDCQKAQPRKRKDYKKHHLPSASVVYNKLHSHALCVIITCHISCKMKLQKNLRNFIVWVGITASPKVSLTSQNPSTDRELQQFKQKLTPKALTAQTNTSDTTLHDIVNFYSKAFDIGSKMRKM